MLIHRSDFNARADAGLAASASLVRTLWGARFAKMDEQEIRTGNKTRDYRQPGAGEE